MSGDPRLQIPFSEVQKYVSADDCWLVIKDVVYNVTDFLKIHPGGPGLVFAEAGTDTTLITYEAERQKAREEMPPAHGMTLLLDFKAYYRSAADQERKTACDESMDTLRRYFFRPRMLRNISNGSIRTLFLGITSELLIYIAPAAMAKLGHPLGEVNLTKATGDYGIVQFIIESLGAKAIIFIVDVGWGLKRTLEARINNKIPKSSLGAFIDDITWVRTIEYVELCVEYSVKGVIISNHGGRQVDYAPAPIDILYEIRTYRPDLFSKTDILIDGGVRSRADVVKLLALGAKAVGFGRTFLYANGIYREEGVKRVIEILQEEIVNTMWNIGASTISDLKPEMVGPSGPWVGANRPSYVTECGKL
ncbi:mitochondrial fmn-dependent dehydrogenase [Leptodontidium sp. MPI-SDFR-AT-0119]|nr:mitochondrial fmn-dependent dehydrogenase [Leptodontidium sp. MPI-SDFR-AT-0119]